MQIGEAMNHHEFRRAWLLAVLAAVAIAGCNKGDDQSDQDKDEAAAIPVETVKPMRADIDAKYSGTAPIEAYADATVIAKVGGEVREILVEEGDDVTRGQVMARLDGDRLRLEKNQAEANLRKAERDFQRNLDIKDRGLISEGDFEKLQFEMEALKATYDLAALELDYTEIKAPIDGVVAERFIKIGNTIEVNEQIFQVTSLEPLVSYLFIPEREYRRIDPGQPVTIGIDALQGLSFDASVARVSPIVDPVTGTFKITIEVTDDSRRLKPGMFGRINIVYDSREMVLQIPRNAVIEEGGETAVFVVADDVAEKRVIRTGYSDAGNVEVLDGLADDDEVVIVGQMNLKPGSKVSIINSAGAAELAAQNESSGP